MRQELKAQRFRGVRSAKTWGCQAVKALDSKVRPKPDSRQASLVVDFALSTNAESEWQNISPGTAILLDAAIHHVKRVE